MIGRRISYSRRQIAFLERRKKMPRADLHAAFVKKFRRKDVSLANIRDFCLRNGWLIGHDGPRKSRSYSKAELAFIRRRRKQPRRKLHAEFVARFGRHDVTLQKFKALCSRKGILTGRDGRFEKGHVPWDKGKKRPFNANSARTQFKKGQLPVTTKGIGYERLNKDGYIEISVRRKNPHTGASRRFVLKHRLLWERKHGKLPAGMALKCKGDRLNTDPSNWEAVPRALLPRLNGRYGRGYDAAPAQIQPSIMAIAKLEHRLRVQRMGRRQ
jgi:hypothetical protein